LSELFRFTPLPEEELGRIRYAALEMVSNAIEWGNRHRKELPVRIFYEMTDDAVRFVVEDQGSGFNPSQLPHAAAEEDPVAHMAVREQLGLREGGFGIMITKGMVDKVEYNEAGNRVTLIKYLRPATTDDANSEGANGQNGPNGSPGV
jgi:anti-sigma regulatory factor (Ser/Thr protein kinase)